MGTALTIPGRYAAGTVVYLQMEVITCPDPGFGSDTFFFNSLENPGFPLVYGSTTPSIDGNAWLSPNLGFPTSFSNFSHETDPIATWTAPGTIVMGDYDGFEVYDYLTSARFTDAANVTMPTANPTDGTVTSDFAYDFDLGFDGSGSPGKIAFYVYSLTPSVLTAPRFRYTSRWPELNPDAP